MGTRHRTLAAVRALAMTLALAGSSGWLLSSSGQSTRLDVASLLDAYTQGRHDAALSALKAAAEDQARDLRLQLTLNGRAWVDADLAARPRRALVAAAFALETEVIRADRGDWAAPTSKACAGRCVLERACTLLQERGAPDEGERLWMLASIALAGGVRDWTFLQASLAPPTPKVPEQGHLAHMLDRWPDEPRMRLARAVALASRFDRTTEMEAPRNGERTGPAAGTLPVVTPLMDRRRVRLEYAMQQLSELVSDPVVGPEARFRLGYLRYGSGDYELALADERAAAQAANDPDVRYLAHFVAAQSAQAMGQLALAETLFASALDARPHSQSATLGLAALQLLRGEAGHAYSLIDASRVERRNDDDPWRMFLYGDFSRLPGLVRQLRGRLTS